MNARERTQWLRDHGSYGNVRSKRHGQYEISWVPFKGRLVLSATGSTVVEAKLKMFDKAKRALFAWCEA